MRLLKDFTGIGRRPTSTNSSDRHRSRPDSHRARRHRCALGLERLEDRVALSTFVVTNLGDGGDGSLRQAIALSNSTPGPNEIAFAPGLSGTITLTSGELQITDDVRIVGPGAAQLSVSGNNTSRVFEVDSQDTEISGLTITAGSAGSQGSGGGVLNKGGLTLVACTISSSDAIAGGGIANLSGSVMVTDSTISGNRGDDRGGGIANLSGSVTVTDSTISDNHTSTSISFSGIGGGIYGGGTISGSTISGNSAKGGGGIYGGGTISGSTISSNSALFGSGGGIMSVLGNLMIRGSTISNNRANGGFDRYGTRVPGDGGGIYSVGGALTITNSTISGNTASDGGSGSSDGGGIYRAGGALTITNTIIAGNFKVTGSGTVPGDISGPPDGQIC